MHSLTGQSCNIGCEMKRRLAFFLVISPFVQHVPREKYLKDFAEMIERLLKDSDERYVRINLIKSKCDSPLDINYCLAKYSSQKLQACVCLSHCTAMQNEERHMISSLSALNEVIVSRVPAPFVMRRIHRHDRQRCSAATSFVGQHCNLLLMYPWHRNRLEIRKAIMEHMKDDYHFALWKC